MQPPAERLYAGSTPVHASDYTSMLQTERLFLSPLSVEYIDDIFAEFTADVTRFMFPKPPSSRKDTEKFVHEEMEKCERNEDIMLVILEKKSREFLGCIALEKINTTHPEFGIWLKVEAHGHGYGREAADALKQWADQQLQYEYIRYPVDKRNVASRKIPESFGGIIKKEYKTVNLSGNTLDEVEYWIYSRPTP